MKGFTPVPESHTTENCDVRMSSKWTFGTGFQPLLNRKIRCSYQGGFTLIEIMVALSIMFLSIGVVAKYNDFHDKKQLSTAVDTILTNLRLAQTLAIQGKKPLPPITCTSYSGYRVKIDSSTTYHSEAGCSETNVNKLTYQLPSGIQFTSPPVSTIMLFQSLTGVTTQDYMVAVTRNTVTKNITISTSGLIDTQ